jgi:hypothetical protein
MSRYSEAERERILSEVRSTLERLSPSTAVQDYEPPPDDAAALLAEVMSVPVESRLDADRRWLAAQEQRFEQARRQRERDARPAPVDWSAIDARVAAAIAAAVEVERERLSEILMCLIAEMRDEQSDSLERSIRSLSIELGEVRATLSEVRTVVATNTKSGDTIDLPNIRAVRSVN